MGNGPWRFRLENLLTARGVELEQVPEMEVFIFGVSGGFHSQPGLVPVTVLLQGLAGHVPSPTVMRQAKEAQWYYLYTM